MSLNNSQLAHIWAQQKKAKGKTSNGNFSFEEKSLYSYTTEIARFVDRVGLEGMIEPVVIYTNQSYSVTTTGKHKFYHAIRQYQSFAVSNHMRHVPNDWNEIKILVLYTMSEAVETQIKNLRKERSHINSRLEWIDEAVSKMINFIDFNFESKNHGLKGVLDYSVLINLHSNLNSTLETYFDIDISKKFDQQRKHNEAMAIKNAARDRMYADRSRAYQEQNRLTLEDWVSGKGTAAYSFNHSPVKLRINDSRIETSHGASVPLDDGIKFYKSIRNINRESRAILSNFKIGEFTADRIENSNVFIGCHQIPLDEMERLYLEHTSFKTFPVLINTMCQPDRLFTQDI